MPQHNLTHITVFVFLIALLTQGCSTSLTSMTAARAYEPGEIQVSAVGQATLHTAPLNAVVDSAISAEEEFGRDGDEPISEQSFRQWLDTALLFALFRPAIGPELMVRAGVTDKILEGLELGFRTDFNLYKGDAKLQLWSDDTDRMAVSVALGYAHHSGVASSWVEYLSLTEFSRKDFDIQVLWGWEPNDYIKIAAAPRFIASRISVQNKLPDYITERLPDEVLRYNPNQLFKDEWLFYGGLNTTLMVGYKYAYLAIDFGAYWLNFKPTVVGEERDFSGFAVSIAGGPSFHYKF